MLEPSLELFSRPYNDDSDYSDLRLLDSKSNVICPDVETNKILEMIKDNPDIPIIYKDEIDIENFSEVTSISTEVSSTYVTLDREFLNNHNYFLNRSDDDLESTALRLKDEYYDGISHFINNGREIYVIPISIFRYLSTKPLNCRVSHYVRFKNAPKLDFQLIPKKIKYIYLTEKKFITYPSDHSGTFSVLYMNLPKEYYKEVLVDFKTLAYDKDRSYYIAHSDSNQTKINHLTYDIATNGLQKVVQLKLLSGGRLTPYYSNKRFLALYYLNLPTIPVAIVLDSYKYPEEFLLESQKDCSELAKKYLEPYFRII